MKIKKEPEKGSKVTLSPREALLFDFFKNHESEEIYLEELAGLFYAGREAPEYWRNSMLSSMRSLRQKVQFLSLGRIERVSRLGVSSGAVFRYTAPEGVTDHRLSVEAAQ